MGKDLTHGADIDCLINGAMSIAHLWNVGAKKERKDSMDVFVVEREGYLEGEHVVPCVQSVG